MQKLSKDIVKKLIYEALRKTVYVDKEEDSDQYMIYRFDNEGNKKLIRANMGAEETKKELENFSDIKYSKGASNLHPGLSMGGYDEGSDFEAASVQRELVDRGYTIGDTGPNKDGVDGFFGPVTLDAWKKATGETEEPISMPEALKILKKSKAMKGEKVTKITQESIDRIIREEVQAYYGAK